MSVYETLAGPLETSEAMAMPGAQQTKELTALAMVGLTARAALAVTTQ